MRILFYSSGILIKTPERSSRSISAISGAVAWMPSVSIELTTVRPVHPRSERVPEMLSVKPLSAGKS